MKNTTKEIIITTCNNAPHDEFSGFKTAQIERGKHDNHGYEVKADTILQTEYIDIGIYGSAHVVIPMKIIVLGYCNDLSFLDSL